MPNAWGIADETLKRTQNGFRSANSARVYTVALYKNDYTPVPDTFGGNFILADFPGAVAIPFTIDSFGSSSVTDHVAMLTLNHTVTFTASPSSVFEQEIFGYVVFDELNNYSWAERFETSVTMRQGEQLVITPRLKQGVCPVE